MTSVPVRRGNRDTETHREAYPGNMEAEIGVKQAISQGTLWIACWALLETRRKAGNFLLNGPWREHTPADTFWLLASRTVREYTLLF